MANIPIYGTLKNETPEGKLAVAAQIFDETEGKKQSEINAETVRTTKQTLDEVKKKQVRANIGAVEEAPKDGKAYAMKDGNWEESTELAFRELWENAGGKYAENDGYSYYGIKLTFEEAKLAYNYPLTSFGELANYSYPNVKNGTIIPPVLLFKGPSVGAGWNSKRTFEGIKTKNIIVGSDGIELPISDLSYRTFAAYDVEKIHNVIDFASRKTEVSSFFGKKLQSLRVKSIKVNISMSECSKLDYESIKYLIDNAANDSAITVTVHPTTYSYLTGTAEPTEQVGGTTEEWKALVTTAAEKQISFATTE